MIKPESLLYHVVYHGLGLWVTTVGKNMAKCARKGTTGRLHLHNVINKQSALSLLPSDRGKGHSGHLDTNGDLFWSGYTLKLGQRQRK